MKMYHATPKRYLGLILSRGLLPSSGNRKYSIGERKFSQSVGRTFLSKDEESSYWWARHASEAAGIKYAILEVEISEEYLTLDPQSPLNFDSDDNLIDKMDFYTTRAISPSDLKYLHDVEY